jgi:hypothetical protein
MSQFLDRLLERVSMNKGTPDVKPQFAPEMIPEPFIISETSPKTARRSYIGRNLAPFDLNQKQAVASRNEKSELSPSRRTSGSGRSTAGQPIESARAVQSSQVGKEPRRIPRSHEETSAGSNENIEVIVKPASVPSTSELVPPIEESPEKKPFDRSRAVRDIETTLQAETSNNYVYPAGKISEGEKNKNVSYVSEGALRTPAVEVTSTKRALAPSGIKEVRIRPAISTDKQMTVGGNRIGLAKEAKTGFATESLEPTVTISIGRIEVRAMMPEKAPEKELKPTLSLEEYLKRRQEGTL